MKWHARPLNDIARDLEKYLRHYPGSQTELANKAGVSQSTISRAMNLQERKRISNGLLALCNYAGILTVTPDSASRVDPKKNSDLIGALQEVWDGSEERAKVLAKVIRSLKPLVGR